MWGELATVAAVSIAYVHIFNHVARQYLETGTMPRLLPAEITIRI